MQLTILTPTFNRAGTLPALFDSLCQQTCKDFEWLVVDDGSSDHTGDLIAELKANADFPVRYLRKENGGRHSAINEGLVTVCSDLTFPVDSDDCLTRDAVESILTLHRRYADEPSVGVYSFLRRSPEGVIETPLSAHERVSDYIKCRIREDRPGNMAEVFRTHVLKEHPFPCFPGERFLSEDVVWIEIAKKYRTVFSGQPIYISRYLEGGLTHQDKQVKFASPLGSMLRGKQLMYPRCGLKANLKGAIIYNCYHLQCAGPLPDMVRLTVPRDRLLVMLTKPFGRLFYRKWNHT